jgi:hypothetical protein
MEIDLKEHWKKIVQNEQEARMRKLKEFIESRTSMDDAHNEAESTIDFEQQFSYELWNEKKIKLKLKEYLGKEYSEKGAYVSIVRPWMKAVKLFMEYVTERDIDKEGVGVGRETYIFSWNPEDFISHWWQPYLNAINFEGVKATVPKNCYGVNFGQLVLDYQGLRTVLWVWNDITFFCPYTSVDEDFSERQWTDIRFLKFKRLTLSAIVEYLRQMPQITEKARAIESFVSSFYLENA